MLAEIISAHWKGAFLAIVRLGVPRCYRIERVASPPNVPVPVAIPGAILRKPLISQLSGLHRPGTG